jgi:pheromone shutdown protein TraB
MAIQETILDKIPDRVADEHNKRYQELVRKARKGKLDVTEVVKPSGADIEL